MRSIYILFLNIILTFVIPDNVMYAQSGNDSLLLRCHYTEHFKRLQSSTQLSQDEMILDIGTRSSAFYSLWERSIEKVTDSLLAQGASFQQILNEREKLGYPRSHQYYTIYKNLPAANRLTYTDKEVAYYLYEEELELPDWEITKEKKEILGYSCQQAITNFRGRQWEVWFTIEIPVSEGPWKLHGLPGLILEAKDKKNEFHFLCIELKPINKYEEIRIPQRKYLRCSREKYMEAIRFAWADPINYGAQFGTKPLESYGADGKPLKQTVKEPVWIEY